VADEFHNDEILLTSHETTFFSILAKSAKLIIFNVIKSSIKLSLRVTLELTSGVPPLLLASELDFF